MTQTQVCNCDRSRSLVLNVVQVDPQGSTVMPRGSTTGKIDFGGREVGPEDYAHRIPAYRYLSLDI